MTLIKPGLKPVLRLFPWNRLQLLLAKWRAIHRSLVHSDTRVLIGKMARRADMTSMMSPVFTRVSSMTARVATSMSSAVPSSASKQRRGAEDRDYADD